MTSGTAWEAQNWGEPADVLRRRHRTWPAPTPGRLLVRVRATGVGLPDKLMTQGHLPGADALPVAPGQEVTGEIVAAPDGSPFSTGERVMGMTPFFESEGGFGEFAYLRADHTLPVPESFTDAEAAGFVIGFRTAYAALVQRCRLQSGQTALVLGATGGTGSASVQLAQALGATVIAVAGGETRSNFARAHGANHVIDHRGCDLAAATLELTAGRGVDVVIDPVGGTLATTAITLLAPRGRIAIVGYASGSFATLDPLHLLLRNADAVGVYAGGFSTDENLTAYTHLLELVAANTIRTAVGAVHPFADVPAAVDGMGSDAAPGKHVVLAS